MGLNDDVIALFSPNHVLKVYNRVVTDREVDDFKAVNGDCNFSAAVEYMAKTRFKHVTDGMNI